MTQQDIQNRIKEADIEIKNLESKNELDMLEENQLVYLKDYRSVLKSMITFQLFDK